MIQGSNSRNDNLDEELQKGIDQLDEINRKQEERIQHLETRALQIANLFFVFQGVILQSISRPSSLKCNHWWIPFVLSLLASIINIVSFLTTIHNFLEYTGQLDKNREDREVLRYRLSQARASSSGNEQYQSSQAQAGTGAGAPSSGNGQQQSEQDAVRIWRRWGFVCLGFLVLLGFMVVMLCGCRLILCHEHDGK